jgi:hypothetical protein
MEAQLLLAYGILVPAHLVPSYCVYFEDREEIPYAVARDCYTRSGQSFIYLKKTYFEHFYGKPGGGRGKFADEFQKIEPLLEEVIELNAFFG